jgi:dTDP-4-dehydrorhamnose 3,5-epimerase
MSFESTFIKDLVVFTPRKFADSRGYFFESYNKSLFKNAGIETDFVQDNQSYSEFGTIRGIHLQKGEHAQAKLVRVLKGKVLDVAVDLRKGSPTFGKYFSIELSEENRKQLFVPRGFGHGFSVLSSDAIFAYKCDNFYNNEAEDGINYSDSSLNIDWQIPANKDIISEKDLALGSLNDFNNRL